MADKARTPAKVRRARRARRSSTAAAQAGGPIPTDLPFEWQYYPGIIANWLNWAHVVEYYLSLQPKPPSGKKASPSDPPSPLLGAAAVQNAVLRFRGSKPRAS